MNDMTQKNIEKTWDKIAESFDTTRRKPWQQCLDFINELPSTSLVVDLGCGNGRHILPCAEHCKYVIGFDISQNLLKLSQKKTKEKNLHNTMLIHGTLTQIPFMNNSCDAVLYIAALHNIQGRKQRIQSLQEVFRILKPGGSALISVWSRWQEKYRRYFFKQFFLRKNEFGDIIIPWKQNNLDVERFYHLYSKQEFIRDLTESGLLIETFENAHISSQKSADNFFAIVRKKTT
jgi:tRNA (uracil-5-)-methyltransferase TRM9